jgi:hypothetical protein
VFESIKLLRPYFFSLREIENNVSLDIKIPFNWKYEEILKPYRILKIKIQDKNDKHTLLSLISNATQNGYDVAFACASEIIKVNQEEEEKQKLFLDKLKDINLLNTDGQEDTTSIGLVEKRDREGSEGVGDPTESDD